MPDGSPPSLTFTIDSEHSGWFSSRCDPGQPPRSSAPSWLAGDSSGGLLPDGQTIPESFEDQGDLIWRHLGTILRAAGMDYGNLVSLRVYLAHPQYDEANVRLRMKYGRERERSGWCTAAAGCGGAAECSGGAGKGGGLWCIDCRPRGLGRRSRAVGGRELAREGRICGGRANSGCRGYSWAG
jgi:hypothetical protein